MKKVKLSTLSKEEIVLVSGNVQVIRVKDILEDIDFYRDRAVWTTLPYHASFNAQDIINRAIENEYENMYEDWDEVIDEDITKDDIEEIQKVLDRILVRHPLQNICYVEDNLIEFDI